MDVAGGKGYLSFQLQCTGYNIPTTLIEPRQAKLNRKQSKQLRKHCRPIFKQICAFFGPELWDPMSESNVKGGEAAFVPTRVPDQLASASTILCSEELSHKKDQRTREERSSRKVEQLALSAAPDILRDCSAVVGLHPDQATEVIVDFALSHSKPFAVVPCCVFPRQFPQRRQKDGGLVITTEEFIQYLVDKDPRIRLAYLEMEGRNKVVYMLDAVP